MRILFVVHGFPPTHSAGAERQAERMARWLLNAGHAVEVFAIESMNDSNTRVESAEDRGLLIHRLYYNVSVGEKEFVNLYSHPHVGNALRELLAERDYDLMHIISGYMIGAQAFDAAHEAGVRVVISLMEFWFMCAQINLIRPSGDLCSGPESDSKCARCMMENKRRYRYLASFSPSISDLFWKGMQNTSAVHDMESILAHRREALSQALNSADLVICNSRFIIAKFAEFGFNTSRFQYIRQGLATALENKPLRSDSRSGLVVGYIGQLKFHKGVDLLVDAVIQLIDQGHDISLSLWGNEHETPDYVQKLKNKTSAYPTIHWNGQFTGSRVWEVLSSFDVLVVPSRWYENSPNVILEAYKIGVPVIATNLGGMAELVEHNKSGLLFTLNDVDSLRHQIELLTKDPILRDKLRSGIPHVKTIDEEMQETVKHYHELVQMT